MKVVIVGGGFGGVKAAQVLAEHRDIEITLISKTTNFEYHAALYRSATGRSPREVIIPLESIFQENSNVTLVQEEVTHIDDQRKLVVSETSRDFHYDFLILAVGQEINYFGIEGLEDNSYSLDTITNTIALREHLREVIMDSKVTEPHFAIVGGGASGVELSAELNNFAEKLSRKLGVENKRFKVTLIEGADRVLPGLKPKISLKAQVQLEKLGVKLMLGQKVQSADAQNIVLESGKLAVDTIIWTAGNRNNHLFRSHDHLFNFSKNTRVVVNEFLEARDGVYVIGDSADTKYTGMAQTALHDAGFVGNDIVARTTGRKRKVYEPRIPIYVVPVGRNFAVYQSKHILLHGYPAWILRRAADFRLFLNFEPLKNAVKSWRRGNQSAQDY